MHELREHERVLVRESELMNSFIYDPSGKPVGRINGRHVFDMQGSPVDILDVL
jgi:hypothetical protein